MKKYLRFYSLAIAFVFGGVGIGSQSNNITIACLSAMIVFIGIYAYFDRKVREEMKQKKNQIDLDWFSGY